MVISCLRAWLGSLGHLQAEGWFLGQREPLSKLICQAGGTVRLAGRRGSISDQNEVGQQWVWVESHAGISDTFSIRMLRKLKSEIIAEQPWCMSWALLL